MAVQERPMISPAFLLAQRKARFFVALYELAREKGFRAVTVADIVKRAGTARNTFYETFRSKDDAGAGAMTSVAIEVEERIVAAARELGGAYAVRAVVADLLAWADEHPDRAYFFVVEGMNEALAVFREGQVRRLTEAFEVTVVPLDDTVSELLIGGAMHILYGRLLSGEPCVEITKELQAFLLAQFE